ncbi:MAG: glycosyltransferase [Acidobacteria bacterium]|nr:glycosyltransferase [Acidobacteriota bacterium]
MRNILIVENSGKILGGGQVSMLELLAHMDRTRYRPTVVAPEEGEFCQRARDLGLEVHVIPMPGLRRLPVRTFARSVRWLDRLARSSRADLLHVNSSRGMIYAAAASWRGRPPILWHVRVQDRDGLLDRILARSAAKIVVNSQAVRRRFSFEGPEKVLVSYNGIDVGRYAVSPEAGNGNFFTAVSVARLTPEKGYEFALRAIARLAPRYPSLRYVIVGEGVDSYGETIYALARELQILDRVQFRGYQADVRAFLAQADVLLLPSLSEGFGRVILEAAALGKPVIASRVGGIPEVVRDGLTGRLVAPADAESLAAALEELLKFPQKASQWGVQAREYIARTFPIQKHVEEIQGIYEAILNAGQISPVQRMVRRARAGAKSVYLALRRPLLWGLGVGFRTAPPSQRKIQSVLVIQHGRLGDIVLSQPAVALLRSCLPDAHLAMMTSASNAELFRLFPQVDEILVSPEERSGRRPWLAYLRSRKFDLVVDLNADYHLRTAWLARRTGADWTAGMDVAGRGRLFHFGVPVDETTHFVDQNLGLIASLFDLNPQSVSEGFRPPASSRRLVHPEERLVISIHPGATHPTQRWPAIYFAELADRLMEKYNCELWFLAGPEDAPIALEVLQRTRLSVSLLQTADKKDLIQALLRSHVLIANNSGPLHLAGFLGVATVSTLGPTVPSRWRPRGSPARVLCRTELPCLGCNRGYCRIRTHDCMWRITPGQMLEAVDSLLGELRRMET